VGGRLAEARRGDMVREAQFVGSVVGLAVGDALGYPAELRSREQILREIGPEGITGFLSDKDPCFTRPFVVGPDHPPGTFTDDTQMTLAVAAGLLDAGEGDLEAIMEAVARHFVLWAASPDNDRAPGQTCMTGCGNLRKGVPWREAGVARSKGCGSAMRVAPVGLVFHRDPDRLLEVARATSLPTHGHPAAVEGAAAAALMVALALDGADGEAMHRAIQSRCFGRARDFDDCLGRVPGLLAEPPWKVLGQDGLGEGWVAEEAVASALYCVWRHPDDFRAAVLEAVNTDGDSDSLAAICGSVMGASLGVEGIPPEWVEGVESRAHLEAVARRLWAARRPGRATRSGHSSG
jgi:ADP-ribosylglycohydrolase